MSPMVRVLEEIRGRPLAIYLGEVSLTKLAAYLRGYEHALGELRQDDADSFLPDFRDWIQQRFGCTQLAWEDLILRHSKGEADAVANFWGLLDEFLAASVAA